jgi:hypothetical protein
MRPITHPSPTPERRRSVRAVPAIQAERTGREFGTGYGRSSGYATARRYVDSRGGQFFRCR